MSNDMMDGAAMSPDQKALLELFSQKNQGADCFPLSFSQQRLWFLDQLRPGDCAYNVPAAIRLRGRFNADALERAFGEIIRRHESLRTTFANFNGQLIQVIAPDLSFALRRVDLRGYREGEREAEAKRLAIAEARHPFDLARGPLLRAALLRLDEHEHVLLMTTHHIVSDGWSMGVLVREMVALYDAFANDRPSPLPELPIQYADYVCWQREWLRGETLERQLRYWRQQLAGAPTILELPTDRPRHTVQTTNGARLSVVVDEPLVAGLKALSRAKGVTLFMTLLAAFNALLYRYTGQEDISVGTATANRNRAEIEGLIGFFANTLVMRTDMSGDPSFVELLGRARKVSLGAYAHQDLPFEKLVDELKPERDLSRQPLFQVMFVMQNAPREDSRLPGLTLEAFRVDETTAKFDLSLLAVEDGERMRTVWDYNADLFEAATIERMSGHFKNLLASIVANPNQTVSQLEVMTGQERRQLLVEWNETGSDYPLDVCLHEMFEQQADRTPEAVAVIFQDRQISYAELNRRANQLARYLQSKGVGPEVRVGVCVERGIEMVITVMGVLKAGGAYVPLDAAYPKQRLSYMAEDAGVKMIVTQRGLGDMLEGRGCKVMCLDDLREQIAAQGRQNVASGARADNLAYVIYTSGSTGQPKGVMVAHGAIVNTIFWRLTTFSLGRSDSVLQNIPLSFDPSIWQIFGALLSGARLVLPRPGGHQDINYLFDLMIEEGISITDFPPSMLSVLLEERDLSAWASLRCLFSGGEALSADLQDRFLARARAGLYNQYGVTESAIDATSWACEQSASRRVVPIGRPIGNTRGYILDGHSRPVPICVPGQLHIGGAGLARGYLNQPALTAEKFIPDSLGDKPGARLYATGDLARYLPDGAIEFLGRADQQVNIRGLRIELGEVEAALTRCPAIRRAAVAAVADEQGDRRLVAYAVADDNAEPTPGELHGFLKQKLPAHMVPSVFVMMDDLPLLPNGKVDRQALPAPQTRRMESQAAFVAPGTPIEEALADIWVDILGVERVGVDDNFFYSGGHSLKAIQMISRARQRFGIQLGLRDFFMSPTLGGLARLVEGALIANASPESIDELFDMVEQAEDGA